MASKAELARRKKAASIARAEDNRVRKATNENAPPPAQAQKPPRERKGLEWLLHKKRITPRQFWAGTEYGNLYRAVEINGQEPLKSCISDSRGGGSTSDAGKIPGMCFAEHDLDANDRLTACHVVALRSETNMIATAAAVCGRQLTPREITKDQLETAEIEAVLGVALNLLAAHFERRQVAA